MSLKSNVECWLHKHLHVNNYCHSNNITWMSVCGEQWMRSKPQIIFKIQLSGSCSNHHVKLLPQQDIQMKVLHRKTLNPPLLFRELFDWWKNQSSAMEFRRICKKSILTVTFIWLSRQVCKVRKYNQFWKKSERPCFAKVPHHVAH